MLPGGDISVSSKDSNDECCDTSQSETIDRTSRSVEIESSTLFSLCSQFPEGIWFLQLPGPQQTIRVRKFGLGLIFTD